MPAPDLTMPRVATPPSDERLVVEADTAEQALDLVREQLGDDAEIVEARKVHRGGWKGFFALERVELTARARATSVAAPPITAPPAARTSLSAATQPVDDHTAARRALEEGDQRDRADFDRMLRRLLEPADAPATRRPSSPSASVPAVAWSSQALEDLRLPSPVIEACRELDRADDLGWIAAIADVVGPWCRPLPTGVPAYVGTRLRRLADALDLPLVGIGEVAPADGPVVLDAPDSATGRAWSARQAGDRWLHVVAGTGRWQAYAFEDVLAVSWTADDQLPLALSMASRLGVVLGYGPSARGREIVRAAPVDVALAIRALMPRT